MKQDFPEELACLERFKMVIGRQVRTREEEAATRYHFRHDKIMEFFIAQTFLGEDNPRVSQHLGDLAFMGVYLLLADLMDMDDAKRLREQIILDAAEKNDNFISNRFILQLRSREKRESVQGVRNGHQD